MVRFDCTMCGRCCHGLRLPLSLAEAMGWLRDGHDVQLFCEAIPWPSEPAEDNLPAMHKRRRSFEAMSGTLPVRVIATLMASFDGPCPNLQPDMRCGIYDRRPATCRIYPAEVNPFIRLDPAVKLCPPEAWQGETTILADDGRWANADLAATIVCARDADAYDAVLKRQLCAALGCATAALSNEGMVIFSPSREAALAALSDTLGSDWRRAPGYRHVLAAGEQPVADPGRVAGIGLVVRIAGHDGGRGAQVPGVFRGGGGVSGSGSTTTRLRPSRFAR